MFSEWKSRLEMYCNITRVTSDCRSSRLSSYWYWNWFDTESDLVTAHPEKLDFASVVGTVLLSQLHIINNLLNVQKIFLLFLLANSFSPIIVSSSICTVLFTKNCSFCLYIKWSAFATEYSAQHINPVHFPLINTFHSVLLYSYCTVGQFRQLI